MARSLNCLITFTVLLVSTVSIIHGMGFPSGGGGCGCGCGSAGSGAGSGGGGSANGPSSGGHGGCCGSGGGNGGHGRRKRDTDAIQPHYMADETPCPQTAWKTILQESILSEDAIGSVSAIQTALFRRYADQKFLVTCSSAEEAKNGTTATNKVHFSSSGDGYCNLVKERVWCQTVALSA